MMLFDLILLIHQNDPSPQQNHRSLHLKNQISTISRRRLPEHHTQPTNHYQMDPGINHQDTLGERKNQKLGFSYGTAQSGRTQHYRHETAGNQLEYARKSEENDEHG